jgi:hypothetical protein
LRRAQIAEFSKGLPLLRSKKAPLKNSSLRPQFAAIRRTREGEKTLTCPMGAAVLLTLFSRSLAKAPGTTGKPPIKTPPG